MYRISPNNKVVGSIPPGHLDFHGCLTVGEDGAAQATTYPVIRLNNIHIFFKRSIIKTFTNLQYRAYKNKNK